MDFLMDTNMVSAMLRQDKKVWKRVALNYNLTLLTDDNHFNRIEALKIENWLRDN